MNRAAVVALVACVVSAVLEGLFAGRGVKAYMQSLRQPPTAPPMWLWYVIGALYYVACFLIIYRLIGNVAPSPTRTAALILIFTVMGANAFWNYIFFRARNLVAVAVFNVPYSIAAVALLLLLVRLDGAAALVFTPYVIYLACANFWSYQLWQLNR